MPNELQSVLDSNARRTAQAVRATIEMAVGDGTGDYLCTLDASGSRVRASVAKAGDTFTQLTPVTLISPDDGTVSTSRYVIVRNPAAVFGTALSNPVRDDFDYSGAAITYVTPNPITLIAGGAAVTIDIYGVGLLNATFGVGGGFVVVATSLQMDTRITLSLTAPGGTPPGDYDLDVIFYTSDGVFYGGFFEGHNLVIVT